MSPSQNYTDAELEAFWEELGDVPVGEDGEEIDIDFYFFPKDSSVYDIWYWFDERHSKGVAWLMNADGKRYAANS